MESPTKIAKIACIWLYIFLHQHQVAQLKKSRFPMAISVEQSKPDPCHCNFLCTFSPFSLGLGQHWQTEWAVAGQWINEKINVKID